MLGRYPFPFSHKLLIEPSKTYLLIRSFFFFFFKSISPFSLLNILLLFCKFLLSYPTCCKGSEVKQYSKHSPIILYKNPSPICLMFAQCHCGCNLNSFWILQSLYIILQIGTCPSCRRMHKSLLYERELGAYNWQNYQAHVITPIPFSAILLSRLFPHNEYLFWITGPRLF